MNDTLPMSRRPNSRGGLEVRRDGGTGGCKDVGCACWVIVTREPVTDWADRGILGSGDVRIGHDNDEWPWSRVRCHSIERELRG